MAGDNWRCFSARSSNSSSDSGEIKSLVWQQRDRASQRVRALGREPSAAQTALTAPDSMERIRMRASAAEFGPFLLARTK